MTFQEMNLLPQLMVAIKKSGYEAPTPIQAQTIPIVLSGRDVLGCAQTGTGKTAAFALPILQRLFRSIKDKPPFARRTIRALILTPTRELAMQIYENFVAYGQNMNLRACVVFGGVSQHAQTETLRRGVDILVATPGRLCDLHGQGFINLMGVEIFVLDEADRMLDMGFSHDVKRILAMIPQKRQTLFFSATMPKEVEELAVSMLVTPETVKVDPVTSTVDSVEQFLYRVDRGNKNNLLVHLIRAYEKDENALVFVRTRHGAEKVIKYLENAGVNARAIHGDKTQAARQAALNMFKAGEISVLVATDIAARGIDIAGLSHVINYDLPNEPEAYIHRIGRTGRAGLTGDAVSFACIDEIKDLAAIERLIAKRLKELECPWPMVNFTPTEKKPRPPMRQRQPDVRGQPLEKPKKLDSRGQPLGKGRPFRAYGPKAEGRRTQRKG